MRRAYLTPLVIAGLLFLPSCSNAEDKACEAAEISRQSLLLEVAKHFKDESVNKDKDSIKWRNAFLSRVIAQSKAAEIVLNNPICFTASQEVEAQFAIEEYKKWFE